MPPATPSATSRVDLPPLDVDIRRPVWGALSELFLDTELMPDDFERIGQLLAQSPYSLEELDEILLWEVFPACFPSMLTIAGEWVMFDRDWLEARIRRGPSSLMRLWTAAFGRRAMGRSRQWRAIKRVIGAARAR